MQPQAGCGLPLPHGKATCNTPVLSKITASWTGLYSSAVAALHGAFHNKVDPVRNDVTTNRIEVRFMPRSGHGP